MITLLKKRVVQLALGLILMGMLGVATGVYASRDTEPVERPDRVVVHAGATGKEDVLPLTSQSAVEQGWSSTQTCFSLSTGGGSNLLGRYFVRGDNRLVGSASNYLLIYNADNVLMGFYFFFEKEMPPPWQHEESGFEGLQGMDFEHWGIHIYVRDTNGACERTITG